MNRKTYILLSIVVVLMINCKRDNEIEKLATYFSSINLLNTGLIAEVDYSKSDTVFLNDVENQIGVDLCENPRFIAKSIFKKIEIEFPAYVRKKCFRNIRLHNIISIEINSKNEVLILDEFFNKESNIEDDILKYTEEIINDNSQKSLIYLVSWDSQLNSKLMNNRVLEILKAIKNYSSKLAYIKYNKDISDLNKLELVEVQKGFIGVIGFDCYVSEVPMPRFGNELN